jgi:hypothetical protein
MQIQKWLALGVLMAAAFNFSASAEEKAEATKFTVGDGKIAFTAPAGWKKVMPRSNIVEAEFSVPAVEGDETPGRLTAMGAGGDIEANIARWAGQFSGPAGGAVKPQIDKLTVGGSEVHIVSLVGTYKDSPAGPFAGGKTVNRENYQMLGAICQTKAGNYFLKLYGPKGTIGASEKDFRQLVESMQVSK